LLLIQARVRSTIQRIAEVRCRTSVPRTGAYPRQPLRLMLGELHDPAEDIVSETVPGAAAYT
jgi:hypothetical protein